MPAVDTIKLRRGTAAAWTSANPVLASGEPGYETDTGSVKVGDGTTAWAALPYRVQPGDPLAGALGYKSWTWNPGVASSAGSLTSQRADAVAIYIPPGETISDVVLFVDTAGAGTAPAGFFVGLAASSSVIKMVAQSANLAASASLTATGAQSFALAAPYVTNTTDAPGGLYYILLLQNGAFGTTNVALQRGNTSVPGFGINGRYVFGNIGSGLTALPANGTTVTVGWGGGLGWFAALA